MSTTGTIKNRLTVTGGDDALYQISQDEYNDTLIVGGGATGALMVRDSGKADGWGLVDAVAVGQVLVSGGVGVAPAWSASPSVTNLTLSSHLSVGSVPATSGAIRLSNATYILARNAASLANLSVIGYDANNVLFIGDNTQVATEIDAPLIRLSGATAAFPALKRSGTSIQFKLADDSGYASANMDFLSANYLSVGASGVASAGEIRLPNNSTGIRFKKAAAGDMRVLEVGSDDVLYLGGAQTTFRIGDTMSPLLQLGGGSASFPALKRNATGIEFRLADDSAATIAYATQFIVSDAFVGPGAATPAAGDLRLKKGGALNWYGAAAGDYMGGVGGVTDLADSSPTAIFEIALPSGAGCGGEISTSIIVKDAGGECKVHMTRVTFAAENKGGVYDTSITDTDLNNAKSTGAVMTDTWSMTTGTNKVTVLVSAASGLTPTTLRCYWDLRSTSPQAVTAL